MPKLRDFVILLFLIQTQTLVTGQLEEQGPLRNMDLKIKEGNHGITLLYKFIVSSTSSKEIILGGETDNVFEIADGNSLRTMAPLDREMKALYKLTVKTINSDGTIIEGPYSVNIIVEDINDNQPKFNQSQYFGEVREQSRPGRPFVTVYATDADDPATPNAQLSYGIMQQFPDTQKVMLFQINSKTGAISTTLNGRNILDVATQDTYELLVNVSDSALNAFSSTTKVYITVQENIWRAPQPVTISENSTASHPMKITEVRWNDHGAIYELHQKEKLLRFPFFIDQNGDIYVTESLDREEKAQHIFYALAKNEQGENLARPLEIVVNVKDINDNPPVCPAAVTVFEVQENEGVGSNIGTLQATDMDEENTRNSLVHYHLLEQIPTLPNDNMFIVNEYTGVFQLIGPVLNIKDFPQYTLKVQVSDEGLPPTALSTICEVQIHVIDINDQIPIFERSDYGNVTFREDTPLETVVMEIQATDSDQPSTGSSAIIYRVTEGDPHGIFEIITDSVTNRGYVRLAQQLDFESSREHRLVIQATNPEPLFTGIMYNDSSITHLRVIVTDVDEKPYFNQTIYQVQVPENIAPGTKLATIVAIDPEGDSIRFSMQGDRRNWLRLHESTGEIFSNAELDRETESHYEVTVIATERNNPRVSSSVNFHLYLEDINDNAPRLAKNYYGTFFCYPLTKPEAVVIEATDDDSYTYGKSFNFDLGGDENITRDWDIAKING
ncbi:hypothetical protein FKM82_005949, partial [Ascaphus truei]